MEANGKLIARTLSGAWRAQPPPLNITPSELYRVTPLLLGSGGGALGWWKVRHSPLQDTGPAGQLQQAYRLFTLEAAIHARQIAGVFTLLRGVGVEPVLVKGWSNARLYPEAALRPYGDIDLCIAPEQHDAAKAALATPEGRKYWIDLHRGFATLTKAPFGALYERSLLVPINHDIEVRVLSPEDHLRLICFHFLRHGGWRPLWLCDIAAAVEARPPGFSWELCLGEGRGANWVVCAVGLAHLLLGARVGDTLVERIREELPHRLVRAVLHEWERPSTRQHDPPELIARSLRHPARWAKAAAARWPAPIEATVRQGGSFNSVPPFFYQVSEYGATILHFLVRLLQR